MFSKLLHFLGLITFITQGSGHCLIINTDCDKEVTWFCERRAEPRTDQHRSTQKCRTLLLFPCHNKHRSIHCARASRKALEFKKQLVAILCQCARKLTCSSRVSFFRNICGLLYGFRANVGMNGFQQNLSDEKFLMC